MDREPHAVRPVVGVTGPSTGGLPAWLFTRWALHRAGARAVRITPQRPVDLAMLDGLVIGGGADVSVMLDDVPDERAPKPKPPFRRLAALIRWPLLLLDLLLGPLVLFVRIVAGRHRSIGPDPARDALELLLLRGAKERGLPVLGICRGAQLMSVAEGGTLLRDIQSEYDERPQLYTVLPRRPVHITRSSRLGQVLGRDEILVNSLHFHAVGQAGQDMHIVAREDSGVPQAIEHRSRRFWIGVQWHPEYLPHHDTHQTLFRRLVAEARATRALCSALQANQSEHVLP